MRYRSVVGIAAVLAILSIPSTASALSITTANAPAAIQAALLAGNAGLVVDSISVDSNNIAGALSIGTYTNATGTYGIGPGVIISSGSAADFGDGINSSPSRTTGYNADPTAAQQAELVAISGNADYFDPTEISVTFHMDPGFNMVFFNVVFGSEEFPEFVNTDYNDAFGLFVDGTNIAFNGGLPINVNHPAMSAISGTQLDGVLAPNGNAVLTFSRLLANPTGSHTLNFIIADRGDSAYDSTAYIASLGGQDPTPISSMPEPMSLVLVGTGILALVRRRRGRKNQS
jgi:hypothetical protein